MNKTWTEDVLKFFMAIHVNQEQKLCPNSKKKLDQLTHEPTDI